MRVTVVVPTYNEAGNIERLCREVRRAAPDADMLIVDDGSPDGTGELAEKMNEELGSISVSHRSAKSGLGAAYRAGLRMAIDRGAEICVQIDADLSHDPAVLPALIANAENGADLAIGSRYVPGGLTENWPRRRRMLSRWGNRYAAGVLGLAVNDATAGYPADGYGFQVEMTYRLVRIGGKVVEFPITFRDRTEGSSKMSGGIVREALVIVIKLWVADFGGRRRRRAQGG